MTNQGKTIEEVRAPDSLDELLVPKPYDPKAKIKVLVATPMKDFPSKEILAGLSKEEMAKLLPSQIGHALHELSKRGLEAWPEEDAGKHPEKVKADESFRSQADKYEFEWMAVVGGICRARNTAVGSMLKEGFDFIIWWDRDLFPDAPLTVAEVWLRLLSHKQPVVGGIYCKRDHTKRPTWAASWIAVAGLDADSENDGLLQVAELAGGATCIHRKVFTEIGRLYRKDPKEPNGPGIDYRDRDTGERLFGFYQICVMDNDLLSEDYFFNFLCRCSRVAILADTKLKLRHIEVVAGQSHIYPPDRFPPIPAEDPDFNKNVEVVDLVVKPKK